MSVLITLPHPLEENLNARLSLAKENDRDATQIECTAMRCAYKDRLYDQMLGALGLRRFEESMPAEIRIARSYLNWSLKRDVTLLSKLQRLGCDPVERSDGLGMTKGLFYYGSDPRKAKETEELIAEACPELLNIYLQVRYDLETIDRHADVLISCLPDLRRPSLLAR